MFFWTPHNVQQILFNFIKKVSNDSFGFDYLNANQPIEFSKDLGLSSIQVMELAAYTNSFFHLFDIPEPPALLRIHTLQGWTEAILHVRHQCNEWVTFKTSGTTGAPKLITHSLEWLAFEVDYLQTIIPKPSNIISLVPNNHIYGFLFTIMLPNAWNIPVIYSNAVTKEQLNGNSLVIATPFTWNYLYASLNQQPINCRGISASEPLNNHLYQSLTHQGFQITEIYGSTETAGVGYRKSADQAFALFDYWNFQVEQNSIIHQASGKEFEIMDQIKIVSENKFTLNGRKDGAVQIAGYNVHLELVKQKIISIPNVSACEIFAKSNDSGVKLSAAVYLQDNTLPAQQACSRRLYDALKPEEYPTILQFYKSN